MKKNVQLELFEDLPTVIDQVKRAWRREAYYRSDRWKVRAEETKRLAGYQCQYFGLSCQGTINLECHHVTYRNEFRETPGFDIICVCRNCHQQIHSQGFDVGKPRPVRGVGKA